MNDLPPMQTPQQASQQHHRKQPQYQQQYQQDHQLQQPPIYYQPPQQQQQNRYQYAPDYYQQAPPQQRQHSLPIQQPVQVQQQPQPQQPPQQPPQQQYYHKEPKKEMSSKQKLELELRNVFDKVDANRTGRISGKELSFALLNFDHTRFQDSTIKLMINLFSTDSRLTFEQFVSLWKYLSAYKKLFIQADTNKSGDISFGEFQKILEQIGYKLDIDLVLHLFQKYSASEGVGRLKFDSFIELLVYLRKLTDIFKKYDKDLSGTATISFSDFLFEISQIK